MRKYRNTEEILDLLEHYSISTDGIYEAKDIINVYGYYNIVNAYKPLLKENYKKFDYFYHLFKFDHSLKSILLKYILLIEIHYKHILSKTISEEIGESVRDYLNPLNYRSNAKSKLNNAINKIRFNEKPMSTYFNKKQGIDFPPWIFLKSIPFGNAINIYTISQGGIKDRIANEMITNTKNLTIEDKKRIFKDSIELLRQFRNSMAHGNKIISHYVKKNLNYNDCKKLTKDRYISLEQYNKSIGKCDLLALFLTILILTKQLEDRTQFLFELNSLFNDYEYIDNQNFIDIILSISKLPNNFIEIIQDCLIIWE